ncbi:MAG: ComF family protein [Planctomycetota bacterium]
MAALAPAITTLLFEEASTCRAKHRVSRFVWRFADAALDLFFPPHCGSCGNPLPGFINKSVCLSCAEKIRWIGDDRCIRCGDLVGAGMGAVAGCVWCRAYPPRFVSASVSSVRYEETGPARDVVLGLKFGGKSHLAPTFGRLLAARIASTNLLQGAAETIVVPAPLMRGALFRRGYNQAEELARSVARDLNLKLDTRLLKKIRTTLPQAMLSQKKRRENLIGAFACDTERIKKRGIKTVLIIDDVITTGSTVSECARTLHHAGVETIYAASFAHS